eukprot:491716-Rhodomonas_salina.1
MRRRKICVEGVVVMVVMFAIVVCTDGDQESVQGMYQQFYHLRSERREARKEVRKKLFSNEGRSNSGSMPGVGLLGNASRTLASVGEPSQKTLASFATRGEVKDASAGGGSRERGGVKYLTEQIGSHSRNKLGEAYDIRYSAAHAERKTPQNTALEQHLPLGWAKHITKTPRRRIYFSNPEGGVQWDPPWGGSRARRRAGGEGGKEKSESVKKVEQGGENCVERANAAAAAVAEVAVAVAE